MKILNLNKRMIMQYFSIGLTGALFLALQSFCCTTLVDRNILLGFKNEMEDTLDVYLVERNVSEPEAKLKRIMLNKSRFLEDRSNRYFDRNSQQDTNIRAIQISPASCKTCDDNYGFYRAAALRLIPLVNNPYQNYVSVPVAKQFGDVFSSAVIVVHAKNAQDDVTGDTLRFGFNALPSGYKKNMFSDEDWKKTFIGFDDLCEPEEQYWYVFSFRDEDVIK